MISRITLKNWRSHLDTDVKFSEGTNALIGIMGSGKSSLMSAMCFALFGTFPELQSKKLKLEDIIMKKPRAQQQAEVSVTFEDNNDIWHVKRTITNGKSSAELRKNSELIEAQPQRVTEEIEKILKLNYDLFTRAIYSEQNAMDIFLTLPKGQRMRRIDELLSIHKFETARSTALQISNKCKTMSEEKRYALKMMQVSAMSNNASLIKSRINQMNEELTQLQKQSEGIGDREKRARDELSILKEKQAMVRDINERLSTLTALLQSLEIDIDNLKNEMAGYAEITDDELKSRIDSMGAEISVLREQYDSDYMKMDSLKTVHAQKQAQIDFIENQTIPELKAKEAELKKIKLLLKKKTSEDIKKGLGRKESDLEKSQVQMQSNIGRIAEIQESLTNMDNVGDFCPVCDQRLTEQKKKQIIDNKKKTIAKLVSQNKRLEPKIEELKTEIIDLRNEFRNFERLEVQIADFELLPGKIKELNALAKQLKSEIDEHKKEKNMLEKAFHVLERTMIDKEKEQEKINNVLSRKNELYSKIQRVNEYRQQICVLQGRKRKVSVFLN